MADQAIRHDLLKGLIELITNSDDSYARLERNGAKADGRIELEVNRRTRTKSTVIRVIDWAEGMNDDELERNVDYGEDTSGQSGRGVFGMGLKDTIIAFGGEGTITSFKDGKTYREGLKATHAPAIHKALVSPDYRPNPRH
jgi:sensor histidine kinase regulating citrate/malate metabolism